MFSISSVRKNPLMSDKYVFVDRRGGKDRRFESDPCRNMSLDLFHRKRRKSKERRELGRTLMDDYYAFINAGIPQNHSGEESAH